jgi:hypothetical protein
LQAWLGGVVLETSRLRKLVLVPWISLPIVLGAYVLLWNRLPSEVAIQFAALNARVSLMGRAQSLLFDLITLLLLLSVGSWILSKPKANYGRTLVRYYFAIVAMTVVFLAVLLKNI